MAGYNLDEKIGLLNMFAKTTLKVVKTSSDIEMRHYNTFNNINAVVNNVSDPLISITILDFPTDSIISPRDFIVLNYNDGKDMYLVSGSIVSIENLNPLKVTITTIKIDKLKDLRKAERFYISLPAYIKVLGIVEPIFSIATNISTSGLKLVCNFSLMLEDMLEITVMLTKTEKLVFRGKVVRKNNIIDLYEYGFEIYELTESNRRNLHHFVNQFKFDG